MSGRTFQARGVSTQGTGLDPCSESLYEVWLMPDLRILEDAEEGPSLCQKEVTISHLDPAK